jgi:hypothetical protein
MLGNLDSPTRNLLHTTRSQMVGVERGQFVEIIVGVPNHPAGKIYVYESSPLPELGSCVRFVRELGGFRWV